MNKFINCSVCGKPLTGRQTLFCSSKCKNHVHQSYDAQKERALERKMFFIQSLGGKCVRCGYQENLAALSFHHRSGKEFELDARSLSNRGLKDMNKEIAKCDLLCANCHMELHHPHLDVAKLSIEPTALTTELQARKSREQHAQRNANLIIAEIDGFEKEFTENLVHCGVKSNQTIVLGVSGGVDSVTMLDLFTKSNLKLNIIVAHMNHGVRAEANLDEKLVKELATKHRYRYRHSHILENVRMSGNQEENLRNARRKFLLDTANDNGADFIALAHNANDQAETFIMNAFRGSGPAGLGAMSISENKIIRPLLNFSRDEIETYARKNKLTWNEDATNQDISYSRNYVRHRILPLLSRLNPEYLSAINRTTHLQRQIDEHFKEEAYRIIKDASCTKLRHLDRPLLYEVLGLLYEEAKGDRQNMTLAHLSAIENLLKTSSGTKTLDLSDNITVKRAYDRLDFCAKKEHNIASAPSTKKLKLGTQRFGNWKITVTETNYQEMLNNTKNDFVYEAKKLPELTIRTRRQGDKIASIGPTGTKKLQDLFVDAKIEKQKRDFWPIITDKSQILWVPSLAKVRLQLKTKKLLKINIVEEDI